MGDPQPKMPSWMSYELTLGEELQLEAAIRDLAQHSDTTQVRELCTSLLRQNHHYQQLLRRAVGRVSELELVMLLGATAEPEDTEVFLSMARGVCKDLGIT